jgi:WD40 repeat protein
VGTDDKGEKQVAFVDVASGRATHIATLPPGNAYIASGWSPNGRSYAVAVDQKTLDAFHAKTARVEGTAHVGGTIFDLGYTADNRSIVVAAGRNIEVLDARTLKPQMAPIRMPHQIGSIDPSPDGSSVFVSLLAGPASWRANVPATTGALVDLRLRRIVHRVALPVRTVIYAAFSPRGDQVAVLGQGGQVLLMSTKTWQPVAPPATTSGFTLAAVSYSPDGSRVLTAGGDQAQLWDTTTAQEIGVVSIPGGATSGGFGADGTITLTDTSGGVYNWNPSLEHEIQFACQAAGRDITYDEWHAAFPDLPYRKVCAA